MRALKFHQTTILPVFVFACRILIFCSRKFSSIVLFYFVLLTHEPTRTHTHTHLSLSFSVSLFLFLSLSTCLCLCLSLSFSLALSPSYTRALIYCTCAPVLVCFYSSVYSDSLSAQPNTNSSAAVNVSFGRGAPTHHKYQAPQRGLSVVSLTPLFMPSLYRLSLSPFLIS